MNSTSQYLDAPKAIITPFFDSVAVGGLSLILLGAFLILGPELTGDLVFKQYVVLTVLLNAPHFMASYYLLYGSKEMVRRYKSASIYVPLVLGAYSVWAIIALNSTPSDSTYVNWLLIVLSLYLALHYTGQTWGMMASFSYLEGVPFSQTEKNALRTCIKVLALWHMVWYLTLLDGKPDWLNQTVAWLAPTLNWVALASLLPSIATLAISSKRTGRLTPLRVWIPLASLYTWYLFLFNYPTALFWVQLSHALQYLIFPARVEANRLVKRQVSGSHLVRRLITYCFLIVASGFIIFVGIRWAVEFGTTGLSAYPLIITSCINIHHFYIDGTIWKISNPEVRKDLFAHLHRA